jgi:hypothetical protein
MIRWKKEKEDNSRSVAINQSKDIHIEHQQALLEDFDSTDRRSYVLSKDSSGGNRSSQGARDRIMSGYYSDRDRVVSVFSERDEYDITAEQSCDRTISVIVAETNMILPTTILFALGGLWTLNATLLFCMGFFEQCDWQRLLILSSTFPLLLFFVVMGVKHVSR